MSVNPSQRGRRHGERRWLGSLLLASGALLIGGVVGFIVARSTPGPSRGLFPGLQAEAALMRVPEDLRAFHSDLCYWGHRGPYDVVSHTFHNSDTGEQNLLTVRVNERWMIQFTCTGRPKRLSHILLWTGGREIMSVSTGGGKSFPGRLTMLAQSGPDAGSWYYTDRDFDGVMDFKWVASRLPTTGPASIPLTSQPVPAVEPGRDEKWSR